MRLSGLVLQERGFGWRMIMSNRSRSFQKGALEEFQSGWVGSSGGGWLARMKDRMWWRS